MFNAQYWGRHFQQIFGRHLLRMLEVLERRLLPTFDTIDQEAESAANAEWERLMHMPGDPDGDPSVFVDQAFEAGLAHYESISSIRQALLNTYAATLYHAWEQQLLAFHRRGVLHPAEEDDNALLNLKTMKKRLNAAGIDLTKLPSWPLINELRLLANAVKHADGISGDDLKQLRPDLFEHPSTKELDLPKFGGARRVYMPLSGDDIFVTLDALKSYCSALVQFWSEFSDALSNA
ncbi:hypothetical protein NLA06_06055 [Desulfomicrobium sp. ZS1]|uniref:hypothetical protein n=1 Tax=Desulfomicrobium sp. ZS1 TaxID=2952228 RepID=UPI0020B28333|nr:hypothetical protein [Desulfomicrobium sp. ZS1]UTF51450.1 hypothetical protein NLA06_06055 [Desulfomicrobium sp. ZS1]